MYKFVDTIVEDIIWKNIVVIQEMQHTYESGIHNMSDTIPLKVSSPLPWVVILTRRILLSNILLFGNINTKINILFLDMGFQDLQTKEIHSFVTEIVKKYYFKSRLVQLAKKYLNSLKFNCITYRKKVHFKIFRNSQTYALFQLQKLQIIWRCDCINW